MDDELGRRRLLTFAVGATATLIAGCGPGRGLGGGGTQPQRSEIVVAPLLQGLERLVDTNNKAAPMAEFLAKESGLKVRAFAPGDYGNTLLGLREASLDAAFLPGVLYLRAREDSGAQVMFRALRPVDGAPQNAFTSIILVRADGGLKSVADLKGKKLLAGEPSDAAAWVLPAAHLKKNGVDPNKDVQVTIRNSGEDAIVQLLQKKGDAAFAAAHDLKGAAVLKEDANAAKTLTTIATIPGAPLEVVAFRKGLGGQAAEKLKAAFRVLGDPQKATFTDKEGKKQSILGQWGVAGLQEAKDADLTALLEAAKLAGIPVGGAKRS